MKHATSTHVLVALSGIAIAVSGVFAFSARLSASTDALSVQAASLRSEAPSLFLEETVQAATDTTPAFLPTAGDRSLPLLAPPMTDALRRVTKKPFGIEIHPATSPVPNDRFDGFHVGVDFETFENEQDVDIPVFAVCEGRLLFKKRASGYGGVAVQACLLDGQDVTVIYGHLNLESVRTEAGERIAKGRRVGDLGRGYSEETDGVRKHLHLGLHAGKDINIKGYVQSATGTDGWLDALKYMAH